MSDAAIKAVFLSYASQDAEAARRIADALRSADVEVRFDQSELVGGALRLRRGKRCGSHRQQNEIARFIRSRFG